jgi:hypothetical protein
MPMHVFDVFKPTKAKMLAENTSLFLWITANVLNLN